jgi:molybdopterin-guanine dinucleotide biosynthesis protein A
MTFSAVILAGGQSHRMGRDKAWLELDGQSLLVRQIETVRAAGATELLISGRAGVDYGGVNGRILIDEFPDAGPLAGLERALAAATFPLLLALAVDMPHLTPVFFRELLRRCKPNCGVIPQVDQRLEPLAAFYPRACHLHARHLLQQHVGASPRQLAADCVDAGTVTIYPVIPADAWRLRSWNRPSDTTPFTVADC